MIVVTIVDVEELAFRLTSDKAKIREEGLKTLNGYLHSTAHVSLWSLLDDETASLDQQTRIRSSTWPGVLHALCVCIENEVAACKKKAPRSVLAKTLRSFVSKAEDMSRPGQKQSLVRKVKRLFQHIAEILRKAPNFVSDYNNVLSQILHVFEYRIRMGKKIYSELLHFYLDKAKDMSQLKNSEASSAKEEAFRNTSTLLSLLQHPPGDFPEFLLENVVDDFVQIFSQLRDEGKIAKKLFAALNSFLLANGLNIGTAAERIHNSVKTFMVRVWLTTRDRELKDMLVLYARTQLKLRYIMGDDAGNLLELVERELDQTGVSLTGLYRLDLGREEKPGSVLKPLRSFLELAAAVLFEAINSFESRSFRAAKRRRKADICAIIKDHLMDGKYLWSGAFCLLVRRYWSELAVDAMVGWLEGLVSSLDRIMLEGINARSFEGSLWTLRCLQELGTIWCGKFSDLNKKNNYGHLPQTLAGENLWQSVWNSLLHWLPLLSNIQVMVEEAFRLLGVLGVQGLVPACIVPLEFWDMHRFTEMPSGNILYFIMAYFGNPHSQGMFQIEGLLPVGKDAPFFLAASYLGVLWEGLMETGSGDLMIREKLLDWCMSSLNSQETHRTRFLFGEHLSPRLLSAAVLALSFGAICTRGKICEALQGLKKELSWPSCHSELYLEADESEKAQEMDLAALDRSDNSLVDSKSLDSQQDTTQVIAGKIQLPYSSSEILLKRTADHLLKNVSLASNSSQMCSLSQLLHLSAILADCIQGVEHTAGRRGQIPPEWCCKGALWIGLANIFQRINRDLDDVLNRIDAEQVKATLSADSSTHRNSSFHPFTFSTLESFRQYVLCAGSCNFVKADGSIIHAHNSASSQPLLERVLKAACKAFLAVSEAAEVADKSAFSGSRIPTGLGSAETSHESIDGKRIMDSDLDVGTETVLVGGGGNVVDFGTALSSGTRSSCLSTTHEKAGDWRSMFVRVMAVVGKVMPDATCATFINLLQKEKDLKIQEDIILSLCRMMSSTTCEYLPAVVDKIQEMLGSCQQSESMRNFVLTALHTLLKSLLSSANINQQFFPSPPQMGKGKVILTEEISSQLAELIGNVADMGLLFWATRFKLVEVISAFVDLDPHAAQSLIEKFLVLLHDVEYQVRLCLSRRVAVLFETWDGHDELLQDVCANFGVKLAMITANCSFVPGDTIQSPQEMAMAETALLSLGNIAIASGQVENNVAFMICSRIALNPCLRALGCAVLNKVAKRLGYSSRWKYLDQLMGQLITQWAAANVDLSSLLEVREVLVENLGEPEFIQKCCPWLVPALIFHQRTDQISWLAKALSKSIPELVKLHFVSTVACILPSHLVTSKAVQERAEEALQKSLLVLAEISEDERDKIVQKHIVPIVSSLFLLCSAWEEPKLPYFTKSVIIASLKSAVDGFSESELNVRSFRSEQLSQDEKVLDKMQIFRADRVFMLLLCLHHQMIAASHPRHRIHLLASLEALLHVLDLRIDVPSTCRYMILIILQSIEFVELQEQCCCLLKCILEKLHTLGIETFSRIIGEQLQFMVSKLVSCCVSTYRTTGAFDDGTKKFHKKAAGDHYYDAFSTTLKTLLHQLTVDADQNLYKYIRDLDPFPEMRCFEPMQMLHEELSSNYTLAEEFVQFVRKAPHVESKVRLSWLQSLCNQLGTRRKEMYSTLKVHDGQIGRQWRCSAEVVNAVWKLIHLCDKHDNFDMNDLAGEFLAAVGVGDPHAVIFKLPDQTPEKLEAIHDTPSTGYANKISIDPELGLSETLLKCIILELRSYLTDSNVSVIELAYKTLKGILSTEKGQSVFLSFAQEEKTYLEMFRRGADLKLMIDMVAAAKQKSAVSAVPLRDPDLWKTSGKSYDVWVCSLTYSLVEHTNDTTLRLCQEMVSMKAPLAELVFPHVFGNLAGIYCSDLDFCTRISKQVEEHVLNNTNQSTRSVQLFLNVLNNLRQCYIEAGLKRMTGASKRRENLKMDKLGANGGSRSKRKSSSDPQNAIAIDTIVGADVNEGPASWNKVYWLHIDYLITARSAQQSGAYFTSVLYVEHWCKETFRSITLGPPDFSSADELPLHLELLLRVYTRINEPDGVYGVVRSHKVISQLLRYEHEGNWSKALENYDLLLRSCKPVQATGQAARVGGVQRVQEPVARGGKVLQKWPLHKGLMRTLQQKGCSHVLDMYSCGISQQENDLGLDPEFKEIQFEEAWRTGNWKYAGVVPISSRQISLDLGPGKKDTFHHALLHSSLKALVEGDIEMFFSSLRMARQAIVMHITHTSLESTQNINPLIVKLQILDCVSQAWKMRWTVSKTQDSHADNFGLTRTGPLVPTSLQIVSFEAAWQENLQQMQAHYELAEPYIAIRKVLLEVLDLQDYIPQHLLQFSRLARKAGRLHHAASAMYELKLMCGGSGARQDGTNLPNLQTSRHRLAGLVEEAKILWAEGQKEMAVNLAQHVLELQSDDKASLLCLTGKWLAETRSSSSHIILDLYLKRAVELLESQSGKPTGYPQKTNWSCRMHYRLAHYADALYRNHQERLMSHEWQAALRLRQHKTREFEALKRRLNILRADPQEDPIKVREYSMKIVELHRQLTLDTEEAQRLQDDKHHFLSIALTSYRSCLYISNKYDLRVVFRLISLWFDLSANERVVEEMLATVQKIQSYKFLPLVYQIASRLGTSKENQTALGFQNALTHLLEKMATDHPYHTLYQLFALANGDRVKEKQRGKNVFVVDMDKKRAAEELLQILKGQHPDLLVQMKKMIEIYIRLAELETTQKDTSKKVPIPRDIRSIRQLELIPVITAVLPVDYSSRYTPESFPHFKGFTEGLIVMNGINAPKYIECLGSDGSKYRQLAKSGNDDMRQDAVMEQLFDLVNKLLQDHPNTQKRNLGIRTYKVIPFTPSAGVLEWVDGTIPLGEYLLGSNRAGGAHGRYGGDDWSFMMCREHMSTTKDKLRAYETVCENFRPVMHNFFLEKFARAADWFEKRLAYTRSVATSSMVGYIVGLGDRHSMNILVDQATAEVVHIDLGVAFEQGLMLKTPERVPFRLTRDIVDGMGVTGVEGVFRRCCEATLSVLRENKEALLTIIEVFIYDPLYNWALSPLKALQRQQELDDLDDSEPESDNIVEMEGNKDAARALFRVKQKLDGYEEGEMRSLEGQVQQLLQDAQDPERLSQLFPGWGAWV